MLKNAPTLAAIRGVDTAENELQKQKLVVVGQQRVPFRAKAGDPKNLHFGSGWRLILLSRKTEPHEEKKKLSPAIGAHKRAFQSFGY